MSTGPTFRDRFLTVWAAVVTRHPAATLLLALVLGGLSIAFTLTSLTFKSDRSDLIDPDLPWQQRYAAYKDAFPRWDDVAVVIDRGVTDESRAAAESFMVELESRLEHDPWFASVTAGFARDSAPIGLILTQPAERVRETVDRLKQAGPVLGAPTLDALLGFSRLGGVTLTPEQADGLLLLLERVHGVGSGALSASLLGLDEGRRPERLLSSTGRLAMMLVSRARGDGEKGHDAGARVNDRAEAIAALRSHIANVKSGDPALVSVELGVTGVPVLESDETALSMRDAALASALALGLIALLMLIAYRGVVVPVFAVLSLLVGMSWSFAWATAAVGHLQLLSITFASMLLGLGIDVAIHLIARLELVHADHDHLGDAVAQAFRGVGPGILTASLTIAAASAAMSLTSFAGVAEMGLIAAGGMVLCTIAIMSCLPAFFMLMRRPEDRLRSHDGGESRSYMGSVGPAFHRRSGPVLAAAAVVMGVAGWIAIGVRYDPDLQKLMPTSTESVVWQKRLEADDEKSVWHAVAVARDLEEARELTGRLRALACVSDVGGVGMLLPDEAEVRPKRMLLRSLPDTVPLLEADTRTFDPPSAGQVGAVRRNASSLSEEYGERYPRLADAAARVAAMSDDQVDRAMAAYRSERRVLLNRIAALRAAELPLPADLPPALRTLMVGRGGSLLLRIYPRSDPLGGSILGPERLGEFAPAVLAAAPRATGPSIQIYESSRLITRAYLHAGLYALAAIVVLLLLDFGPTRAGAGDMLCAMLPVAFGGLLMLAIMRLVGVDLNFANMIVLPLLIGIGVGCGVHAVRRWRLQPNDHPLGLAGGSGRAITLTTLTTVIGFAVMMTGEHRGIWSLGFVMSVGLAAVWAVTVLVLPAVLRLRSGG